MSEDLCASRSPDDDDNDSDDDDGDDDSDDGDDGRQVEGRSVCVSFTFL